MRFYFDCDIYKNEETIFVRILSGNYEFILDGFDVELADILLLIIWKKLRSQGLVLNCIEICVEHVPEELISLDRYKNDWFEFWSATALTAFSHEESFEN